MIKIKEKVLGNGNPCFIIAEGGVNHNGDINLAKKMVDKAVEAGADAIKFQTFKSEKLVTKYAAMAKYQKDNMGIEDSQFSMLKKLELSYDEFADLKEYCDMKGIIFMSTPFDFESADFLNSIGMEAFKISSGDLTNIPMLEHIAKFNKPIILSSGMAVLGEIEDAVMALRNLGLEDIAVLHCTSNYPAPLDSVNLKAMNTIKNTFKVVGGYSDHTNGITIPIAAAALGADIIEKHFTLDKNMEGPDHKASLEPHELKRMVEEVRKVEISMGTGIKMFTRSEMDTMKVARKSIVASRDIKRGEIIQIKDLDYKRPGNGLSPKYYKELVGKRAKVDIKRDEQINLTLLED
ncbi:MULTISPECIES: N-acetylneuraminate synthase [Clostridium]|uniref:N,N'-diacetyllegionaminic acid synthase n=2 Tax=Clostridium TaxID=1485 RepID=A0A151ARA4_9CLOT|nr:MULTISPECIES: N-acetylneuraminate synthase [Clostridium]KYH30156.1 N,N'-diacetyllegionaminic acid synthase [Clostridium colicanis DSM 13634]MBE6044614.1 N-acetylneuraminate synthase [Clostridium thermopalmarium]PRR75464.1 N,N'-diacetyllegionaminic acid synthase [Clostridium thermopalmarium DSM 5974]PVZ24366.1 N-acetylneuraminate synthase [Clostridium thermopalmarium DSM 5974]